MNPTRTPLHDPVGLLMALCVVLMIGLVIANMRLPKPVKNAILAGLAMRVVGASARFAVLYEVWRGVGDARGYYGNGYRYAQAFLRGDYAYLTDQSLWQSGHWYGTQFVRYVSGVILTFTGPTFYGEFIIFSLFPFIGLVGCSVAFARAYPHISPHRYILWIMLFPSLWFWPSSVGKEAIMLMGIGLAVAGFVGREGRMRILPIAVGLFFVFAIRAEVAAVIILCLVMAYWLSFQGRWTVGRVMQAVVILGIGFAGIQFSLRYIGIEGFDTEGVQSYVETKADRSDKGGSAVGEVSGILGAPVGMVNILFRPFPWEATSFTQALSALEIVFLWGIVWYRRRVFLNSLRNWRSDRLLQFSISFILIYTVALGMAIANLGIIARQRVFLFPFLFVLVEAAPLRAAWRQRAPVPRWVPRPTGRVRLRPSPAS